MNIDEASSLNFTLHIDKNTKLPYQAKTQQRAKEVIHPKILVTNPTMNTYTRYTGDLLTLEMKPQGGMALTIFFATSIGLLFPLELFRAYIYKEM